MEHVKRACLIALSDPPDGRHYQALAKALEEEFELDLAPCVLEVCTPQEKAAQFNEAVSCGKYDWILDVSGGDFANTCLPWIDFEAWKKSRTQYAGFSDCTTIVNALAKTGKKALLFGMWLQDDPDWLEGWRRFLSDPQSAWQLQIVDGYGRPAVLEEPFGGGNIRCLMKLAGTPWQPDFHGKTLFLESSGCRFGPFVSFIAQMVQCGLFDGVKNVVLGHFNAMEKEFGSAEKMWESTTGQIRFLCPHPLNVYYCPVIGHFSGSRGIWIE